MTLCEILIPPSVNVIIPISMAGLIIPSVLSFLQLVILEPNVTMIVMARTNWVFTLGGVTKINGKD
jgi:hypothetical protein